MGRESRFPRVAAGRASGAVAPIAVALASVLTIPSTPSAQSDASGAGIITLRASAVAELIGQVAGHTVRVPGARIFWVIDARALVVESDASLQPAPGNRDRLLVLVERGTLRIPRPPVNTSPVTIVGRARTLLGIQADGNAGWPAALTPELIERLEIRAAVLASSLQTADGIELTSGAAGF